MKRKRITSRRVVFAVSFDNKSELLMPGAPLWYTIPSRFKKVVDVRFIPCQP